MIKAAALTTTALASIILLVIIRIFILVDELIIQIYTALIADVNALFIDRFNINKVITFRTFSNTLFLIITGNKLTCINAFEIFFYVFIYVNCNWRCEFAIILLDTLHLVMLSVWRLY